MSEVPLLQFLVLSQAAAFVTIGAYVTLRKRWKLLLRQPLWFWAASIVLILVSQLSYLAAFRFVPAAQVDLINYQWPMLLALSVAILPGQRSSWPHVVGAVMGMLGVWCLFLGSDFDFQLDSRGLWGSLFALIGCLSWVGYSLLSRLCRNVPAEMVSMTSLFSLVVFGTIQLAGAGEPFVVLSLGEWGWVSMWGVLCFALAYPLWDVGLRRGNPRTVARISYLTPAGSILFLVLFGLADAGWSLAAATTLVVLGSVLGNYRAKRRVAIPVASEEDEEITAVEAAA